jgi:hypothetical protein
MVIFPQMLQDAARKGISWKNDISISIAGVLFTGKPAGCTPSNCSSYDANVVWNSGPNKRTCGVLLTPAPDTATPSPTTLPTDVFGPGSLIVVDIVYNYAPIFGSVFTKLFGSPLFGTIPIARSAYLAPRYVQAPKLHQICRRERRRWHWRRTFSIRDFEPASWMSVG